MGGPPANQEAIAGEGLGVRIVSRDRLLHHTQGLTRLGPGMQVGLGHPAPPDLIFEAQCPIRMVVSQANQPIPSPFFRAYPGSGLVIHFLARCHRTPRRAKVARMVSPLTLVGVNPCSKLTSAARSSPHKEVGLPYSRGLWCSMARNPSSRSPSKAAWIVWGRHEPFVRQATPDSLNAPMALRTVWGQQPNSRAICGAHTPLELASRIWHRRNNETL